MHYFTNQIKAVKKIVKRIIIFIIVIYSCLLRETLVLVVDSFLTPLICKPTVFAQIWV